MNAWSGRFVVAWVAFGVLSGGWLAVTWAGEGHRSGMSHGGTAMQHGRMEVGDAAAPPAVTLVVHKDPKAGWNLQVRVENFRFAPEHASTAHVAGEGHAHFSSTGRRSPVCTGSGTTCRCWHRGFTRSR